MLTCLQLWELCKVGRQLPSERFGLPLRTNRERVQALGFDLTWQGGALEAERIFRERTPVG
jgi:hypothetical protein